MKHAAGHGARAVLILPVDLPFIAVADVEMMLGNGPEAVMPEGPGLATTSYDRDNGTLQMTANACTIAICADEKGDGTNALFLDPARDFTFQFGPGSFRKHLQEAQKRGRHVQVVSAPGLKFDIDNERDWVTYQGSTLGC
jgi:2-phospho-L-lactate guanylyltransferase